jgi:hypothetical protein
VHASVEDDEAYAGRTAGGLTPDDDIHRRPRRSRFVAFTRDEWSRLRDHTPAVDRGGTFALRGLNDEVTLPQVEQVYLPRPGC